MLELFNGARVALRVGDCLERLAEMPDACVDSVVTDPPYGLSFMGKHWDQAENIAFCVELWVQVLRVLKPGGHLLAFSGTRTYHRMAVAIEDAGFEIRDQAAWTYGSGFPKSRNLDGEWEGWGSALKPAWEPICVARKPLEKKTIAANVLAHGTGALNIDACRIESAGGCEREDEPSQARRYSDKGATNFAVLPGPRGGSPLGRWPANIIHDGSPEVVAMFPQSDGQQGDVRGTEPSSVTADIYGKFTGRVASAARNDSGSAARFFYCAKASPKDRRGSKHPTVKPVSLLRWLVRLVTPPKGTVLDVFAGTGTCGEAALHEGFRAVLIERELEYVTDIRRRLAEVECEINGVRPDGKK